MIAIRAALGGARRASARACWCRNWRMAPTRRRRRRWASPSIRSRRTSDGRVDLAALKAKLGPDVAAIMLTNPNTCGLFERDIVEIAAAVHEAGALFLLRRRQFQRHRRPRAAGRSRHRRDAYQSAQDLLDPAWRRRAGRGPGRAVGSAGALRAVPGSCTGRTASGWSSTPRAGASLRPAEGLSRPDGHVRPRADLYDVATAPTGCGRRRATRC